MKIKRSSHIDTETCRMAAVALMLITVAAISMLTMFSSIAGPRDGQIKTLGIENMTEAPERSYISIHIQEGDTLQSIAQRYNDGRYYSEDEYIEKIKLINQIDHEKIHPGCYLVIMRF